MQAQSITDIIESDAMSQLGIEQSNQMTPRAESADFVFHSSLASQLGNEKPWNQIAYLPQQIQFGRRWNVFVLVFHPCRVAGLSKSFQLFPKSYGMAVLGN